MEPRPRRRGHFMFGLRPPTLPEHALERIGRGQISGYSNLQIKNLLRTTTVSLLMHQNLAARYRQRVNDEENFLVILICAGHSQMPSIATILQRQLNKMTTLPLPLWAAIYYAIVNEVRIIAKDLQENWETELDNGHAVIHTAGITGSQTDVTFTARDMTLEINRVWRVLMNAQVLGPLEEAVRVERVTAVYRGRYGDDHEVELAKAWNGLGRVQIIHRLLHDSEGMLTPTRFTIDQLANFLRVDFIPLLRKACLDQYELIIDPALLKEDGEDAENSSPGSPDDLCMCGTTCKCRPACYYGIHACACKVQRRLGREILRQNQTQEQEYRQGMRPDLRNAPRPFLGAATNHAAQLQVAAIANPTPSLARAAEDTVSSGVLPRRPKRCTAINDVSLPNVPTARSRVPIPNPLFGNETDGRYPRFRQDSTYPHPSAAFRQHSHTKDVRNTAHAPPQRPLPPIPDAKEEILIAPQTTSTVSLPEPATASKKKAKLSSQGRTAAPTPGYYTVAPILGVMGPPFRFDDRPRAKTLSRSKPKKKLRKTKSFPEASEDEEATLESPPTNEFADWVATSPIVQDFASRLFRSRTPRQRRATGEDEQYEMADLPVPPFMSPPIATKQRYVRAGGNAKLEDREEISDFAFPRAMSPGGTKMLSYLDPMPTPDTSQDSKGNSLEQTSSSNRTSRDEKRAGKARFRKFRQLFSRKNSDADQ